MHTVIRNVALQEFKFGASCSQARQSTQHLSTLRYTSSFRSFRGTLKSCASSFCILRWSEMRQPQR